MSVPGNNHMNGKSRTRTKMSTWLPLLGVVLVVGLAIGLFAQPYLRSSAAGDEATVLRISMGGWDPGTVVGEAGQPITVTMLNLDNQFHTDGGGWHNFVVPELGVSMRVAPKGTETFTFVAEAAGEYEFYCDICCGGKENPFMQGTLRVS